MEEVGNVKVAPSLWRKNIPCCHLGSYKAWDKKFANGIPPVHSQAVQVMLDSIGEAGPLKRCLA